MGQPESKMRKKFKGGVAPLGKGIPTVAYVTLYLCLDSVAGCEWVFMDVVVRVEKGR